MPGHRSRQRRGSLIRLLPAILVAVCFLGAAPGAGAASESEFTLDLSAGYRPGSLRWNIAGDLNGENPNILSELTWSNLQILHGQAEGKLSIERFTIHGAFGFGVVLAGDTRDSDYNLDDRTDEWSRSYSDARGGYILHALTGAGYRWDFLSGRIALLPMFGIGFHRQAMVMTDGVQIIPATGPFPGLDSSYTANWLNVWVGVDAAYRIAGALTVGAGFSVHPSLYYALADWNLRTDFAHPVSFVHRAIGLGIAADLSLGIELSRNLMLEGRVGLDYWFTGAGVDETYLAVGGSVQTRLNEVVWFSPRFSLNTAVRL
jgi:hypothetical protein